MRRLWSLLLILACLLSLAACGEERAVQSENPEALTLYECGGLQVALPSKYLALLHVERDFPDAAENWEPLLSVYEKASYEATQAEYGTTGGFLFGLTALDQAAFEQMIDTDASGIDIFASDGERYYAYTYPTDVQFFRPGGEIDTESEDWASWEELNEIGPDVREDFLTRNHLQTFNIQDLTSQPFPLDETHICLRYYPYFLKDGDTRIYYDLLLSQPARQGEGGVWAVERWINEFGAPCFYFPDSGQPAAEYYADLQAECDGGGSSALLTPAGAAAAFVADEFGHETGEGCFERVAEIDQAYMDSNQRLEQLILDLIAGRNVAPMDLLDCLSAATPDNWGVLSRALYGTDWFQPLMQAVSNAAVGSEQPLRDRALMTFYLATLDANADFRTTLQTVLARQREADPEAFLSALAEFPEEQQVILESVD